MSGSAEADRTTTSSSRLACTTAAIATDRVADGAIYALGAPLPTAAVIVAMVAAVGGCGRDRYVDATYHVTKAEGGSLCLQLVKGDGERNLCDQFPKVETVRPIQVGDCVLLRLLPESSCHARLVLKPDSACR